MCHRLLFLVVTTTDLRANNIGMDYLQMDLTNPEHFSIDLLALSKDLISLRKGILLLFVRILKTLKELIGNPSNCSFCSILIKRTGEEAIRETLTAGSNYLYRFL